MGEIVFLDVVQRKKSENLQTLWDAYVEARARCEKSLSMEDGMAAGRAWAAWLDAFRAVYP
ncbi:MAG: hypothetical protein P0Y65_05695 [Candidatus Devosia phytovorans]|uniref:Uncharacterized protein n=1 Tax=Candidatus Devosia phytovorans TaxID=3121372 RepID=A0AAJ5VYA3_9HYPH|nr:hypothetical protein [Devosia sp.]WEK05748.1 MAG: hypothetical protein P0Y65_05695 [Devosia sp.]